MEKSGLFSFVRENMVNIETWAVVFATLVGPILAVQAQQFVARRGDERQRKLWLFRSLMNTRAGTLTIEHVNALNAIPLEFHKDVEIMRRWRNYLDHLNNQITTSDVWVKQRVDLYSDMLATMAARLDYGFDPLQVKNEIYAPRGHFEVEADQEVIRRGLVDLMKGDCALPLEVRSIAQDPDASARIAALQEALTQWLHGDISPKVKIDS